MRPSPTNCSPPPPSIDSATVHTASSSTAKPVGSLGLTPTRRLRRVHSSARPARPTPGLLHDRHHDGPVDLWTALLRRVPTFALRAILWTARGQPLGLPTARSQAGGCPQSPPARKSVSKKSSHSMRSAPCRANCQHRKSLENDACDKPRKPLKRYLFEIAKSTL